MRAYFRLDEAKVPAPFDDDKTSTEVLYVGTVKILFEISLIPFISSWWRLL
jgi:hypothetical protein